MTYEEATAFLFDSLPMFQSIGAHAYKPGLHTVTALSEAFGAPHRRLRAIHVGGTNGKGSVASLMAASLSSAGYRTGLYTSPHLIDFRERMRVDGQMITPDEVVSFVERYRAMDLGLSPSFFELTTVMAFEWFVSRGVDVAVIEVGLGGRLDSTNIINPEISVITNISRDHTALLGDTLPEIAAEKAGIIKPGVPAVIGEAAGAVRDTFVRRGAEVGAEVIFAGDRHVYTSVTDLGDRLRYDGTPFGTVCCSLTGDCQPHNAATALTALSLLRERRIFDIPDSAVARGFSHVGELTGLAGRWMTVATAPLVICDTGHNTGGWSYLSARLRSVDPARLHLVIGFVNDKDVSGILAMMPRGARCYFTQASVRRALPAVDLAAMAAECGLHGAAYESVAEAYAAALAAADPADMIFVGGSTFVVADFLSLINK